MDILKTLIGDYGQGLTLLAVLFATYLTKRKFSHTNERIDRIDGRLDKMDGRLDRLEDRVNGIDTRLAEMNSRLAVLEEREGILRKDVDKLKESQRRAEDRILKIETINATGQGGYDRVAMGG